MKRRASSKISIAVVAFGIWLLAATAQAQFPEKPVTILVPSTAGGTADALGRFVGSELANLWGRTVVIENRPGALGIIATEALVRSQADGYTIGLFPSNHAILPLVRKNLSFDFKKDLTPLAPVAVAPGLLVVNHTLDQVRNVKEAIDLAKANPSKFNYAIPVPLTNGHRTMELLKHASGAKIEAIPYKGGAQAVTDLIGNQVQFLVIAIPSVISQVESGRLRALAVTTAQRFPGLPDVPTLAESGFAEIDSAETYGFFAPTGVLPQVVQKLSEDVRKVLSRPNVIERLQTMGAIAKPGTPEDLAKMFDAEFSTWAGLIDEVKLYAD